MRRVAICLVVVAATALAVGRAARSDGDSRSFQLDPVLNATVGPGFTISLTDAGGTGVTQLAAGPYSVAVSDQSTIHNFHLNGPNVDQATTLEFVGSTSWPVTLGAGNYHFQCDLHTDLFGDFTVVGANAVRLRSLSARRANTRVVVRWRTAAEVDTLGFNVFRAKGAGARTRLNRTLIRTAGPGHGGQSYVWTDRSAPRSGALRYWLQVVGLDGTTTWHGPARAQAAVAQQTNES